MVACWRCEPQITYFTSYSVSKSRRKSVDPENLCFEHMIFFLFFAGKISTKLFFTITGLAGLFVCFVGHRYFKCGEWFDLALCDFYHCVIEIYDVILLIGTVSAFYDNRLIAS